MTLSLNIENKEYHNIILEKKIEILRCSEIVVLDTKSMILKGKDHKLYLIKLLLEENPRERSEASSCRLGKGICKLQKA